MANYLIMVLELGKIQKKFDNVIRDYGADGCEGCAFMDMEEMPCKKCKRANKDYWRQKAKE